MKRRVLMFRKQSHDSIQGICKAGTDVVYLGQPCTVDAKHGGGFVGEMELEIIISVGAHKFFHNLEKDPCRILRHDALSGIQEFIPNGTQSVEAIIHSLGLKVFQQVDDGMGYAEPP